MDDRGPMQALRVVLLVWLAVIALALLLWPLLLWVAP